MLRFLDKTGASRVSVSFAEDDGGEVRIGDGAKNDLVRVRVRKGHPEVLLSAGEKGPGLWTRVSDKAVGVIAAGADEKGALVLGTGPNGGGVSILAAGGREVVQLRDADGDGMLSVNATSSARMIQLQAKSGMLSLVDGDAKTRIALEADTDAPALSVFDQAGDLRAVFGERRNVGRFSLMGKGQRVLDAFGGDEGAALRLGNPGDRLVERIRINSHKGEGRLYFFDKLGTAILDIPAAREPELK
jgi:hypothetical protein